MGRSVSTPHNATVVAYRTLEVEPDPEVLEEKGIDAADYIPDEEELRWAFESIVEDLQNYAPTLWPSLRQCDEWLGREDHALLENDLCYMGISEYCGLIATWIVPKDEHRAGYSDSHVDNLANNWVAQIERKFLNTFGTLRKLGNFSNGEAVFERREAA